MAIDPSIPLQVRQPQFTNPAEMYSNALALQGGIQRNALLGLQTQQAQRDAAAEDAMGVAYRNALSPDGTINRNALLTQLAQGNAAHKIPGVQKQLLEVDNTKSQIDERQAKILDHYYKAAGGVFGSIAADPQATREKVIAGLQTLRGLGLPEQFVSALEQRVPQNAMEIPGFARQVAVASENGRQALTALAPKVEWRGTGQQDVAYNTNALAGPVAPIPGVAPIQQVMNPGQVAQDARSKEQMLEQQRHNRQTESAAFGNLRVAQQNAEQGKQQIVTDEAGNITIVNKGTGQARPAVDAQGNPLKGKDKLTEQERMSAGYAERMERAGKILDGAFQNRVESKPGDFERAYGKPGLMEKGLGGKPVGGETIANAMWRSPGRQQYIQAQEDWVRAKLRRESGAVIGEDEMANEIKTYFPQIGDSDAVIRQKAQARATATQAMRLAAGNAKVQAATGWTVEQVK